MEVFGQFIEIKKAAIAAKLAAPPRDDGALVAQMRASNDAAEARDRAAVARDAAQTANSASCASPRSCSAEHYRWPRTQWIDSLP